MEQLSTRIVVMRGREIFETSSLDETDNIVSSRTFI